MKYFLSFIASVFFTCGLFAQQELGYFNHTQVNFLIGEESEDSQQKAVIPSFQSFNGFRVAANWGLGVGVGVEPFEYKVYPVFAGIYYFFTNVKHSPYFALKAGHAFSNSTKKFNNYGYYGDYKHKGGLMVIPEFGFRFKMFDYEMTLSGGYRFQRLKSQATQGNTSNYTYDHQVEYNRVSFSVGILF